MYVYVYLCICLFSFVTNWPLGGGRALHTLNYGPEDVGNVDSQNDRLLLFSNRTDLQYNHLFGVSVQFSSVIACALASAVVFGLISALSLSPSPCLSHLLSRSLSVVGFESSLVCALVCVVVCLFRVCLFRVLNTRSSYITCN